MEQTGGGRSPHTPLDRVGSGRQPGIFCGGGPPGAKGGREVIAGVAYLGDRACESLASVLRPLCDIPPGKEQAPQGPPLVPPDQRSVLLRHNGKSQLYSCGVHVVVLEGIVLALPT